MVKARSGRPTKHHSMAIEQELMVYYAMGVLAWKAALQTGHNYKTCLRYWAKFKKMLKDECNEEIAIRQRNAVTQFKTVYSNIVFNLNAKLNETIGLQQAHKKKWLDECAALSRAGTKPEDMPLYKPDNQLEDRFIKINHLLSQINVNQVSVLAAPFVDEETSAATLQRMQEESKKAQSEKHDRQDGR